MLKNEDIICISSIDWDFIWQGHQEIMTRLAKNGNRVLFIENTGVRMPRFRDIGRIRKRIANWFKGVHGVRKISEGLYVYSPMVLPFPYLKIARFINKRIMFSVLFRWLKAIGFQEPIVWTFLPTGLSLDLISELAPKVLIYYCIDSFQSSSKEARKIKQTEEALLRRADLVFVTSEELQNYCSRQSANVHYFPFGVNIDNFARALTENLTIPDDMKHIKKPIAGYIGGIHKWIDFDLVKHIAEKNKDISFVFCGPIQRDVSMLEDLPNIKFLGQKNMDDLPAYVSAFDVCLIPYLITDYTRNVYPTKLNEYLSIGKPVISTELPEVLKFNAENGNIVDISPDKIRFSDSLKRAAFTKVKDQDKIKFIEAARKNSWADKLNHMSLLIEKTAFNKSVEKDMLWEKNISKFFSQTRKKLLPLSVAVLAAYVLFFHTTLLWQIAKPLTINDLPAKSDAIAVFGGGVGESGKVGQGYEERVDTAVTIYKNHISEKIIFFSGYKHIMDETQVMKALSIYLGVKSEDIILDDTPVNTYEMIMDLKKFIEMKGWSNVILVSSPYHMRRLKMLCDKNIPGVKFLYVPVQQSSFYQDHTIGVKQIKGVLQECVAIIYYKFKGYI